MKSTTDTAVIANSFSQAAQTYDAWSFIQTLVARRLCSLLPDAAERILDMGCGTGLMTDLVRKKYRTAFITGVDPARGMIELCEKRFAHDKRMTFVANTAEQYAAPCSFDLIVATCSAHWFPDKQKVLNNFRTSLTPDGRVAAAIPLEGSLPELYESFRVATGSDMPGLKLLSPEEYYALFSEAGFALEQAIVEEIRMTLPDAMFALNSLRKIGGAPKGLSDSSPIPDDQLHRLVDFYHEHFSTVNGVHQTYQFLFCAARNSAHSSS